jgi:hypothetical protein
MELPVLAARAELVRRYAHLLHHFGAELGQRPLVRHDATFFPDHFEPDEPSLLRLLERLQQHAGLQDIPIRVRLLSNDGVALGGGCGSGSCSTSCGPPSAAACAAGSVPEEKMARLEDGSQGWTLNVFEAELHHPVGLTTQLALALGSLFLAESSSAKAPVEAPHEVSRDLACVGLGLGLIVLEGSYIYAKSCGGPSVTQLTSLSVGELAIACSLFIALGRHSARRALADLSTTQRSLLSLANGWAASNASLLRQLGAHPGQLATRAPEVQDTRSWLLRVFERSPRAAPAASASSPGQDALDRALAAELGDGELLELARDLRPANARPRPAHEDRERAELAALVDEALRG